VWVPSWGKGKGKRKDITDDMAALGPSEAQGLRKSKKTRLDDSDDNLSSIEDDLIPSSIPEEYENMGKHFQVDNPAGDNNHELSLTQSSSYDMNDIGSETQALLDANRNLVGLVNDDVPHFDNNFDKGQRGVERARNHAPLLSSHSDTHALLNEIASEYRFSFEEVEEVYQETNRNINITERHFHEVRTYITEKREELRIRG